jgi:hypothetical protein
MEKKYKIFLEMQQHLLIYYTVMLDARKFEIFFEMQQHKGMISTKINKPYISK